jgi:hypothetical protein
MDTIFCRIVLFVFLVLPIYVNAGSFDDLIPKAYDEDAYSECILKNTTPSLSNYSMAKITEACRIKATPKRCRGLSEVEVGPCANECKEAGWWSREYGDCSTD